MNSYEMHVKVNLEINLKADTYKDAVKQVEYWLLKQDIVSDFDIIKVDAYCDEFNDNEE